MPVVAYFFLVGLKTNQQTHVVIVGGSIVEMKETMKQLMKAAQVMGINMQETKYIKIKKKQILIKLKNLWRAIWESKGI